MEPTTSTEPTPSQLQQPQEEHKTEVAAEPTEGAKPEGGEVKQEETKPAEEPKPEEEEKTEEEKPAEATDASSAQPATTASAFETPAPTSAAAAEVPPQQTVPPALLEGWHETQDPSTGQVYYYHVDGRTSWERPVAPEQKPVETPQPLQVDPITTPAKVDPVTTAFSPSTTAAAAMAFGTPAAQQTVNPPQGVISFSSGAPTVLSPLAEGQPPGAATPAASNIFAAPPSGGMTPFGGVASSEVFSSPTMPSQAPISNDMRASTEPNVASAGAFSSIQKAPNSGAADLFASPPSGGVSWSSAANTTMADAPAVAQPAAVTFAPATSGHVSPMPNQEAKP
eukprot:Sro2173_g317560.1 n/a (338) ;mRNA; r:2-1100